MIWRCAVSTKSDIVLYGHFPCFADYRGARVLCGICVFKAFAWPRVTHCRGQRLATRPPEKMFILVVCVGLIASFPQVSARCKHSRDAAYTCIGMYADTNGDDRVSRKEIGELRERSLHYWERAISWLAGETADSVLRDCDANGDGYLDTDDFVKSADTCLATCQAVEDFFYYVCDRHPSAK